MNELLQVVNRSTENGQPPVTSSNGERDASDFIVTPDNIIKILMLGRRMRQSVPVVIQGHTGIGKTYLVSNFARMSGY
jgi:predicted AAA+ superfamily ATPase